VRQHHRRLRAVVAEHPRVHLLPDANREIEPTAYRPLLQLHLLAAASSSIRL
jgi:hypothetical protein